MEVIIYQSSQKMNRVSRRDSEDKDTKIQKILRRENLQNIDFQLLLGLKKFIWN